MSRSDIIATMSSPLSTPSPLLISRLRNAFSLSHVLFVPLVGLHLQALIRET